MMKLKGSVLTLLLMMMALTLGSCDNDDDNYLPPNPVVQEMNKLYPEAQRVEWERKGSYYVADCYLEGAEQDMWFDANANWVQTEKALFRNDLPADVNTSFIQGKYGLWVIEEITQLTFPENPTQFVIEVEQGRQEIALFYSEFGGLLHERDVAGDDTLWPE